MTQETFNEYIMEYEARMVLLAKEQGYELLITHSLYDPVTEDIFTGGHGDVQDRMVVPYMAMKQISYINGELMK